MSTEISRSSNTLQLDYFECLRLPDNHVFDSGDIKGIDMKVPYSCPDSGIFSFTETEYRILQVWYNDTCSLTWDDFVNRGRPKTVKKETVYSI